MTVIFHELGHLAGLDDLDSLSHPDDFMTDILATGVRRTSPHVAGHAERDAALVDLLDP